MKHIYLEMPESLKGTYADYSRNFGFSWKEFVATVPSPLFLVTTYKSNGLPNACMQSWATFTSADRGKGFYAILASVNKTGHLYQTLKAQREAVINFMSAKCHAACMATIRNNAFEADEITASGLTEGEPGERPDGQRMLYEPGMPVCMGEGDRTGRRSCDDLPGSAGCTYR